MVPEPGKNVILALDTARIEEAEALLNQLQGVITYYKIGFEFFTAHGWKAVDLVRRFGARIFLDLKLHDIPTTVIKTVRVLCEHQVDMFNVHALGGHDMMRQVTETVDAFSPASQTKPKVLAVTILTSHSEDSLAQVGLAGSVEAAVLGLGELAQKAGLDGVVCSPRELKLLRERLSQDFCLVTPGIRPAEGALNDQKRVCTPREAFRNGADFIVVGRPITASESPRATALDMIRVLTNTP
jgi:orotidine-5'-phosphate decarboxylase